MFVLEVHTNSRRKKRRVPDRFVPYRNYYKTTGEKAELARLSRKMRRKGYFTVLYDERFARSNDYRELFFSGAEADERGRYQCVYCGRKKIKEKITVDHIIPVGAVKRGKGRFWLHGRNVNDPSNLAPACFRCNEKKSDKIGLWPIKARLGTHSSFFIIKRVIILLILIVVGYILYRIGFYQYLRDIVFQLLGK